MASFGTPTQLPNWALIWFYATAAICTWDATFIMLRPHTLPGGYISSPWYVYKYYVTLDQRYNDTEDAYVFAQSLMNYLEVVINIVTIIMHYRKSHLTIITAFTVSVMTMWKTVLYFLMMSDFCTNSVYRQGNNAWEEFVLVFIPNFFWIVMPTAVMVAFWKYLTPMVENAQAYAEFIRLNYPVKTSNGLTNGYMNNGFKKSL